MKTPPELMDLGRELLGIVRYTVTGVCVLAVLLLAGHMAISHRRGDGANHLQSAAFISAACLLAGVVHVIASVVTQ